MPHHSSVVLPGSCWSGEPRSDTIIPLLENSAPIIFLPTNVLLPKRHMLALLGFFKASFSSLCFSSGNVPPFLICLFICLHSGQCTSLFIITLISLVVAQTAKHLPTMQETWVRSLGWEDPLEKEMANHSRALAWRTPWTEEPGRLQSMRLQRVGHGWATSLSLSLSEH